MNKERFQLPPHAKKCKLCGDDVSPPDIKYRNRFSGWVCSDCNYIYLVEKKIQKAQKEIKWSDMDREELDEFVDIVSSTLNSKIARVWYDR